MCERIGTESLKLVSLFIIIITKYLLNTALNGLLSLTSTGWHFELQPAGIGRISELLFWIHQQNVWRKHQMIANPSLLHSASVCLSHVSSVQTFIKSLYIQAFFCVPGRVFKSQIVFPIFPMKMMMGGRIFVCLLWLTKQPSDVFFLSLRNEPHTPSHLFS